MCGIIGGFSTYLSDFEKDIIKQLLIVSSFRGFDSTGIVSVYKGKKNKNIVTSQKTDENPLSFLENSDNHHVFKVNPFAIIGHTRAATVGDITPDNAHPFGFKNVIGVHNGTIRGNFEGSKEYDTDSEALYALIDEKGIEEALKIVKSFLPAYALVYVNYSNNSLNFIRNNDRPLWFAQVNKSTIYYASEKAMLMFVLGRAKVNMKEVTWTELPPYELWSYNLGSPITKPPTITKFNSIKPYTVVGSPGYHQSALSSHWNYEDAECDVPFSKSTDKKTHTTPTKSSVPVVRKSPPVAKAGEKSYVWDEHNDRPRFLGSMMALTVSRAGSSTPTTWYRGPNNFGYLASECKELYDSGCCVCGTVPTKYYNKHMWLDKNNFICDECSSNEELAELLNYEASNLKTAKGLLT